MQNKNLIVATILSVLVILGWGYLFPQKAKSSKSLEKHSDISKTLDGLEKPQSIEVNNKVIESKNVTIENEKLAITINTQGLKVQSFEIKNSIGTVKDSPLLSSQMFAQTGFISQTHDVPNQNTIWLLESSAPNAATFKTEKNGVDFLQTFKMEDGYIVKIETKVVNNNAFPISLEQFSRINQAVAKLPARNAISHEGAIAFTNDTLQEKSYHKTIKKESNMISSDSKKIWFGFTDKYTLATFIVKDKEKSESSPVKINFIHVAKTGEDSHVFQADSLSPTIIVEKNASYSNESLLFLGAKSLKVLEKYGKEYKIPSFDKAIDFGVLYFITKPIFSLLNFVYKYVGSFAIAIVILTVIIKLTLLPLTVKSSISMARMKKLQPEIKKLQEQYKDNKQMLGMATIKLYKEKQLNPLAGCLPMLIQLPIFFALYKVLYVSTEMKNAHLFFWIKDLSSPDPSSILNIFGLLPFHVPPFLGVLPIAFGISMFLYQKSSPQPADAMQAKMMKFRPVIMTVVLSGFAAGLLFYWIVSNIISIIQQLGIEKFVLPKYEASHNYHSHGKVKTVKVKQK